MKDSEALGIGPALSDSEATKGLAMTSGRPDASGPHCSRGDTGILHLPNCSPTVRNRQIKNRPDEKLCGPRYEIPKLESVDFNVAPQLVAWPS